MATVSQTIPNYYGGLSEQPDELKIPGQVNKLINTLPDITHGLMKRPGGRLVGGNMGSFTTDSKWFHYYRDENEQYIGQIQLSNGDIKMWRCDTGAAATVQFRPLDWATATDYKEGDEVSANSNIYKANEDGTTTGSTAPSHSSGEADVGGIKWQFVATQAVRAANLQNYLKTVPADGTTISDSDIQTLTLNDFTYFTNRNKITAMKTADADLAPKRPPEAYVELKKVAYASQYSLNIFDDTSTDEIYTAIRIDIQRDRDSSNTCNTDGYLPTAGNGTFPGDSGYTSRCDPAEPIWSDSLTPNVATQIFKIDHGDSGDASEAHENAHTFSVTGSKGAWATGTVYVIGDTVSANSKVYRATTAATSSGSTAPSHTSGTVTSGNIDWEYYGTLAERKNLYFRITNQGQAVAVNGGTGDVYRSRYTTTFDLLYGGEGWRAGDWFYVWMKHARYKVMVKEHNVAKVQGNLGIFRPAPTSFDTKTTTTSEGIMGGVRTAIENKDTANTPDPDDFIDSTGASVAQVGNGLYLTRDSVLSDGVETKTFNVTTGAGTLFNVFSNTIKDITDLPSQCKNGYIVRVANSVADEDDYFVEFKGTNGRDGPGTWEECAEPGRQISFDETSMPIHMRREGNGVFTIHPNVWDDCLVGDSVTVQEPSFIGKGINKMLFFRNRMVMLSDENVIMSRPGDFFNYWPKTAVTYTASDPVDLSCSSEYPAVVYDGIQVNTGLLLFTKNQQFMLTTDSDVLSPNTAKINALATYNFNFNTNPISLGTTVAFLDNAGKYARFFEITAVLREGQPEVLEQSKPVSKSFPKDINIIANSRENSVIFFGKQGEAKLYAYRYFSGIEKRLQQAWFQWELSGAIQHMAMLDDALYVVIRNKGEDVLQKFNIKIDDDSNTLIDDQGTTTDDSDDVTYRVHLDNAVVIPSNREIDGAVDLTLHSSPTTTSFACPAGFNKTNLSGTYTRALKVITVTSTAHEFTVGQRVNLEFDQPNGATNGEYTVLTKTDDTFTVEDTASGTINTDDVIINAVSAAIIVAASDDKTLQGVYGKATSYTDSGTRIRLQGNWKTYVDVHGNTQTPTNNIIFGYLFDMEVGFPTLYRQERGVAEGSYRADIHSTLVLHRVKFSFGPLGVYDVIVKKTGKDDYTETFEALSADAYVTNTISFEADKKVTIPIYEKNKNLDLTLKSTHPSPSTLYSLTWEGDYTDGYYKRV